MDTNRGYLMILYWSCVLFAYTDGNDLSSSCRTPGGIEHENGATFNIDCNQCECTNGNYDCTLTSTCKPDCTFNCTNFEDGDYQSCLSCTNYVTCAHGRTFENRPCPAGLLWDDNKKRCEFESSTCQKCEVNELFYYGQCRCNPGHKLERKECVFDCTPGPGFNSGRTGDTFITFPGAEIECSFRKDFFVDTLEDCVNDCLSYKLCRSVVYYNTKRCYHSPCDTARDLEFGTQPTPRQNPNATLFVRNCVL